MAWETSEILENVGLSSTVYTSIAIVKSGSSFVYRIVGNGETRETTLLSLNNLYRYRFTLMNSGTSRVITDIETIPQGDGTFGTGVVGGFKGPFTLLVDRELKNTAPTQPGSFTQPTGELEIGDTRTISWGASTDAEGGIRYYTLEASVNNGSWQNVENGILGTSKTYVIPTATSIKFRVQALDYQDTVSPYRESQTYTVTKPKYYWSRYYARENWDRPQGIEEVTGMGNINTMYKVAVWDTVQKKFNSAPQQWSGNEIVSSGEEGWVFYSSYALRYTAVESGTSNNVKTVMHRFTFADAILVYSQGTLVLSGIVAVEDAYPNPGRHTDKFWYERGSRVNQSIAPTGSFTAPTPATVLKPGQGVSVTFTASAASNISLYELEYRYNSGLWTTVGTNDTALSRSFTPTTDKTLTTVQFRVRAKNTSNVYSDYVYSEIYNIEHNAKPTITLTTADNPSLTENTNLVIAGQAVDTDNGNVLTVYYQINTGTTTAIATGISNGTTPLTYSKTLQFRQGTLYDGTTSVFANLVGNQTYTLKVWAEDNQGGKSDVQTRSFTVVPNRAPIVTVAAITTTTDKINNDSITVNGTVTDPDNQTVVVKYRINNGALVQAYSGAGGNYTFNFKLASLNDGDNIVEIQASDVYGLTTTIRRKFTKTKNKKELLESVVRYRGILPAAGITGVVAWFEREKGDLTLTPALSLTTTGQNESFANMNLSNTGPVTDTITEDQYQLATDNPKTGMTLKVNLKRTATTSDKGIKKITGALQ